MTPIEFQYAMKDYYKEKDNDFKADIEIARYVVMHIWNAQNRYVKQVITDAKKYFPFPWEKEKEKMVQSLGEMKAQIYNIANVFRRKFGNKDKE